MQKISERIGNHQFCKIGAVCMDCGREFIMQLERTGTDKIEIKAGAIGKRGGEYLFKCHECFQDNSSFGLDCDVYSRVVGFLTPTSRWNKGKRQEFKNRKVFKPETLDKSS